MIMAILFFTVVCVTGPALCTAEVWQAPDQEKAAQRAREKVEFVDEYVEECITLRGIRLHEKGISINEIEHSYLLLDSPIIKAREDQYGPVRFTHGQHAASIDSCALCHHYRPEDRDASETTRCSACHQDPFDQEHPERIGLKAAYHLQCVGCHEEQHAGPRACRDCHLDNVPDHRDLVQLPENPRPSQVTQECLRCHESAGQDMLTSAHWLWTGPSLYTAEHTREIHHGKGTTALNNY